MRIDRTHRSWFVFSIVVLALAALAYYHEITHGRAALNGTSGSNPIGLLLGALSAFFLFFAAALIVRKRFRTLRIGSAQFWVRGHLWLGALVLPMAWLHGGFRHGGPLTTWSMWLLYIVIATGIIGALLQHLLPRQLTQTVRQETIFEQIPAVLNHLRAEAEQVMAICGPRDGTELETWRAGVQLTLRSQHERSLMTDERYAELAASVQAAPVAGTQPLREFYVQELEPFLAERRGRNSLWHQADRATAQFNERRLLLPRAAHPALKDLQSIVEEARGLFMQRRMHMWLHGWLLIHVPAAIALVVLVAAHVIFAVRYAWPWP